MPIVPLIEALIAGWQKLKKVDPVEIAVDACIMCAGIGILAVLVANS